MKRHFSRGGEDWTAQRQPGGWGGVVPDGELPPAPKQPVIVFPGPNGSRRSLTFATGAHPTRLDHVSDEELVELLSRAI